MGVTHTHTLIPWHISQPHFLHRMTKGSRPVVICITDTTVYLNIKDWGWVQQSCPHIFWIRWKRKGVSGCVQTFSGCFTEQFKTGCSPIPLVFFFFTQDFIYLSEGWGVGQREKQMPGCTGNPMRAHGCWPEQKAHVTNHFTKWATQAPPHTTTTIPLALLKLCCHLMFYMIF